MKKRFFFIVLCIILNIELFGVGMKNTIKGEEIKYINTAFCNYSEILGKQNIDDYIFTIEINDSVICVTILLKKELKIKGGGGKYYLDLDGNIISFSLFK
ncbi:MAG: hypothetical protein IKZ86_05200 [Spirochaetaceae bacterium]|nr:hypothetical protein [Spirochaetaceae bacterium]